MATAASGVATAATADRGDGKSSSSVSKDEYDAALQALLTSSPRRDHKYVWCSRCGEAMCMRIGARGCYKGHAYAIQDISREEFERREREREG